jgi:hypothetical protein
LTYLAQHDDLQFHLFSCKWHNFICLYGWVILHGIYTPYLLLSTYWLVDTSTYGKCLIFVKTIIFSHASRAVGKKWAL